MTLEEQCRLSYYQKIAEISDHKNIYLVQHIENKRIFVRKEQKIYNKEIYEYLMQCDNPHSPKIFGCVEDSGMLIVIEEYVQGESLEEHLKDVGVYDEREVCHFMITICDVLEQLHQLPQPVIHRDLKPDNIIIQDNGYLKIIDFNTAKQFEAGRDSDTVIIGTREFAAPEQYGFRQSDARTDIYAMGVMMNYLLTKEFPKDHVYGITEIVPNYMTKIIQKCIEFAPDRRYQSVMELRRDLQKCINRRPEQDQQRKKIPEREGGWNIRFLPPGFRTGVLWKMVIALFGYFLIFWIGFSLEVTESDGSNVMGFELWANRFTVLIWMLLTVAFDTNYLKIQSKFPFMRNKYLKWIGYLLYPFLFLIILVLILIMLTG